MVHSSTVLQYYILVQYNIPVQSSTVLLSGGSLLYYSIMVLLSLLSLLYSSPTVLQYNIHVQYVSPLLYNTLTVLYSITVSLSTVWPYLLSNSLTGLVLYDS